MIEKLQAGEFDRMRIFKICERLGVGIMDMGYLTQEVEAVPHE